MNRAEFLSLLWQKAIRPLTMAVIFCYGIVWLTNTIKSIDLFSTMQFIFVIALIIIGLALINMLLFSITSAVYSRLPNKVKNGIYIISKILNLLNFFGIAIVSYYAFVHDNYIIAGLCVFYIIGEVRRMLFVPVKSNPS